MKVEPGRTVKMAYELSLASGEVVESSEKRGPITYTHGGGGMLPGLEKRLEGLGEGDEKEGVIPAGEAYAPESLPTLTLARSEFPESDNLEPNRSFQAKDNQGNPVTFTVLQADDEQVKVRLEHPLSGKELRFKVKILEVS